jgi:hypothetical protein
MKRDTIILFAVTLAGLVFAVLYIDDCRDESIERAAAAERAVLDAEQAERDLHFAIAWRARNYTLRTNRAASREATRDTTVAKAERAARDTAGMELRAWLDSLRTGMPPVDLTTDTSGDTTTPEAHNDPS